MSKTSARLALACALLGLVASVGAAYVHYRMLADPTYVSVCDVNATVSCSQVYASQYSTVKGVPVAIVGAIWFGVALLLSLAGLVGESEVREGVPNYLFAGSTASLAAVLYFAYTSFFVLKLVCVLCLLTYVAVIGLFLVSGAASNEPMLSLPRRAVRDLRALAASPLAIVLSVLLVGGSVASIAAFPREALAAGVAPAATQDQRSELERFLASAPRVPLIVAADGAKVVIVKFNDFQCPACGQSYLSYKPILAKYQAANPGAIKLILKDYPLNPECNANVHTMLHPAACAAAVAVRLARLKGKGDEMEEWLFTHQQGMTVETVKQAVREVAQIQDFDARYAATLDVVKGDIAYGKQLNITSTPTFFINGVKVEGAWAPQFFDQALAYELQHGGGK
jgi:uncharacterized membrane protein/predicted DsbA family dithiol-disulfide isomerase